MPAKTQLPFIEDDIIDEIVARAKQGMIVVINEDGSISDIPLSKEAEMFIRDAIREKFTH